MPLELNFQEEVSRLTIAESRAALLGQANVLSLPDPFGYPHLQCAIFDSRSAVRPDFCMLQRYGRLRTCKSILEIDKNLGIRVLSAGIECAK